MIEYNVGIWAAHAAMNWLMWLVAVVFFFVSLCVVRRKHEAVRSGLMWHKLAWFFFASYCFWDAAVFTLVLVYNQTEIYFSTTFDEDLSYLLGTQLASQFAMATGNLANYLILLSLVSVGAGILALRASPPGTAPNWTRIVKFVTYGFVGLLLVLTIAAWAAGIHVAVKFYEDNFSSFGFSENQDLMIASGNLFFTTYVLLLVGSIALVAFGIYVMIRAKQAADPSAPNTTRIAGLFLAATILFLTRQCYVVGDFASQYNLKYMVNKPSSTNSVVITQVIFDFYVTFVVLVLVFVIGITRPHKNGLWLSAPGSAATAPNMQFQQQYAPPMNGAAPGQPPANTMSFYGQPPGYPQNGQQQQYGGGYFPQQQYPQQPQYGNQWNMQGQQQGQNMYGMQQGAMPQQQQQQQPPVPKQTPSPAPGSDAPQAVTPQYDSATPAELSK